MKTLNAKIENLMDAKYNDYLDNGALRMGLTTVVFSVWLAAGFALLKFAL
jgi:hypothetical protein